MSFDILMRIIETGIDVLARTFDRDVNIIIVLGRANNEEDTWL